MTPFSLLTYCSFFTHYKRKRELTRELVRTWQYGHPIAHMPILVPSRDSQEHAIENSFRRIPLRQFAEALQGTRLQELVVYCLTIRQDVVL